MDYQYQLTQEDIETLQNAVTMLLDACQDMFIALSDVVNDVLAKGKAMERIGQLNTDNKLGRE